MKSIMVQTLNSYLARTAVARLSNVMEINTDSNIACEGSILVQKAVMAQDYDNYKLSRPYLKLIGEVQSIRGEFPHNVGEVVYDTRQKPSVEYRYELTDDELAVLCQKGLFNPDFKCPQIFEDNVLALPLECSVISIAPTEPSDEPLLFVGVENPYTLVTDSLHAGYDIVSYFDDKVLEEQAQSSVAELSEQAMQEFSENELDIPVDAKKMPSAFADEMDADLNKDVTLTTEESEEKELERMFDKMINGESSDTKESESDEKRELSSDEAAVAVNEPELQSEKEVPKNLTPKTVPETVLEDSDEFHEDKDISMGE